MPHNTYSHFLSNYYHYFLRSHHVLQHGHHILNLASCNATPGWACVRAKSEQVSTACRSSYRFSPSLNVSSVFFRCNPRQCPVIAWICCHTRAQVGSCCLPALRATITAIYNAAAPMLSSVLVVISPVYFLIMRLLWVWVAAFLCLHKAPLGRKLASLALCYRLSSPNSICSAEA